jgi:hypothetical protein
MQRSKFSEKHRVKMSSNKPRAIKENDWAAEVLFQKITEPNKDRTIKCPISCECDRNGRPIRASTGAASPLHVVGTSWRYISEHHTIQPPDVDPELHCGGR